MEWALSLILLLSLLSCSNPATEDSSRWADRVDSIWKTRAEIIEILKEAGVSDSIIADVDEAVLKMEMEVFVSALKRAALENRIRRIRAVVDTLTNKELLHIYQQMYRELLIKAAQGEQ